jgi:hypothetical protein
MHWQFVVVTESAATGVDDVEEDRDVAETLTWVVVCGMSSKFC